MSTVNEAKVWVEVRVRAALNLQAKLDQHRVKPFYHYEDVPGGYRNVGFTVPRGMTVAEAILLLARLAPEGTEVHAS